MVCYFAMYLMKIKWGVDDSLDVFAVHGTGGVWGALITGIFATTAVNPAGADGLLSGNAMQFVYQLIGVVAVGAFAFTLTLVLGKLVDVTIGLRVGQDEETVGLDIAQHGERAYGGLVR